MRKTYLLVLCMLSAFLVQAQDPTPSPFTFNGYVDTYYFANTNGVNTNLGASGFERIFDQKANNFQLGLAQFKTTYTAGSVTGVMDLTFGNHGDLGNYGNKLSPLGLNIGTTGLAIKQAYVSWAMNNKCKLTAGQFGTHVGYEVIDAPVNFNYSLSNLFGNGPFYHTGVKLDVAVSDKFAFMVGVNNGLDSKDDNNSSKGLAAQIFLKPADNWSLYLNYFGTNEGTEDAKSNYNWFDITTTLQATEKLLIGLNAVPYGIVKTDDATGVWWGAALYLNTSLTKKFGLGLRAEYFDNTNGGIYLVDNYNTKSGVGAAVTSLTLTGNVNITDHLKFKPEVRLDSYSDFHGSGWLLDKDNNYTKDNQTTIGGALVFHF